MTEEMFRLLEEAKKEKERAYIELKGMIKGIRLSKLNEVEDSFLKVIEMMFKGFKSVWDDIIPIYEQQLHMTKKIANLENEVKELKQTLDKLHDWK